MDIKAVRKDRSIVKESQAQKDIIWGKTKHSMRIVLSTYLNFRNKSEKKKSQIKTTTATTKLKLKKNTIGNLRK